MESVINIIQDILKILNKYPILIVILLIDILMIYTYPKIRGFFGEFWIKKELKKLPKEYRVLNNIMIKINKKTHQIDHIVVSKYGIMVIETKNYYGLIKGNEYDEKWTQYLGKKKYKFLNPIVQNYGHINALKNLLNIDINNFISIICFSNQAKLSLRTTKKVTKTDFLIKEIVQYKTKIVEEDIDKIVNQIKENNITTSEEKIKHIKAIKKIKEEKELEQKKLCPKCRGKLVTRQGKYGEFMGCSNYPKCKYTRKFSEK